MRNARAFRPCAAGRNGPKAIAPTAIVTRIRAKESTDTCRRRVSRIQRTIAGVIITAPATSPSHQVAQMAGTSFQAAAPTETSAATPKVALMGVLMPHTIPANFAIAEGTRNEFDSLCPSHHEKRSDEGFERIPERDHRGRNWPSSGCRVRDECSDKYAGENAVAAQHDGRERKAGWRPDRRGTGIDRGELEATFCRHKVQRRRGGDLGAAAPEVFPSLEHARRHDLHDIGGYSRE